MKGAINGNGVLKVGLPSAPAYSVYISNHVYLTYVHLHSSNIFISGTVMTTSFANGNGYGRSYIPSVTSNSFYGGGGNLY